MAFGPVSHRVGQSPSGRGPDGDQGLAAHSAAGPGQPELHSSTVLHAAAALFAIAATIAGLMAGGSLLPHRANALPLELRGTLPMDDAGPARLR